MTTDFCPFHPTFPSFLPPLLRRPSPPPHAFFLLYAARPRRNRGKVAFVLPAIHSRRRDLALHPLTARFTAQPGIDRSESRILRNARIMRQPVIVPTNNSEMLSIEGVAGRRGADLAGVTENGRGRNFHSCSAREGAHGKFVDGRENPSIKESLVALIITSYTSRAQCISIYNIHITRYIGCATLLSYSMARSTV